MWGIGTKPVDHLRPDVQQQNMILARFDRSKNDKAWMRAGLGCCRGHQIVAAEPGGNRGRWPDLFIATKGLKLVQGCMAVPDNSRRGRKHSAHSLPMPQRFAGATILRVSNWDEVVHKINGPHLGPGHPFAESCGV